MACKKFEDEWDYEREETTCLESSTALSVDHAIQALLRGGLAESIKSYVATETARVLHKASASKSSVVESNLSVSKASRDTGSAEDSVYAHGGCGSSRARTGAEILEPFDPDSKDCNVVRWLSNIDRWGAIHGWSEYEKTHFMQTKLQGGARAWYNRLDNYNKTWSEWRISVMQAFSREYDYAQLLREMLSRTKVQGETMIHYYHDKVGLMEKCGITGTKAVSCLIDGLPTELVANAREFQCSTVGDLYTEFLVSWDRSPHGVSSGPDTAKSQREYLKRCIVGHDNAPFVKKYKQVHTTAASGGIRCYNCQMVVDHISKNCPQDKVLRCMRCGQVGHNRFHCPRPTGMANRKQCSVSHKKVIKVTRQV